ncbi:hypothetical protein [Nocardia brasiliensis]|uniref:hypothetical protein n=1 Tax=Nocardia brasiliensis TaxID=37326 RepID=UPI002456E29E|nr:hypothetical protein [Nocardia brasiliensis]
MNADEIRAEAIERIARADYLHAYGRDGYLWETTTETIHSRHRERAARHVDALGDLLPTREDVWVDYLRTDREAGNIRYLARYTTAWRPIEGTEAA